MYLLAQTYDPGVLAQWRVLGAAGDAAKAQELYERAARAGIAEATPRALELQAKSR